MDLINEAISAGKFPDSRRAYYERLLAADPQGTQRLIARLEPGVPGLLPTQPADARRGMIASDAGRRIVPAALGGYTLEER